MSHNAIYTQDLNTDSASSTPSSSQKGTQIGCVNEVAEAKLTYETEARK